MNIKARKGVDVHFQATIPCIDNGLKHFNLQIGYIYCFIKCYCSMDKHEKLEKMSSSLPAPDFKLDSSSIAEALTGQRAEQQPLHWNTKRCH